ncbi:MAG TPA: beta-propeller fold lactonase family protein [Steroidobacteraceae bacterium]|nr:beta-propeller fold lactonase family protein [Steroidobacteraceae bacterium]
MNRMFIGISLLAMTAAAAASNDHGHRLPFQGPRAVYTETNAADKNEILVYRRDHAGNLRMTDRVATRGRGSGAGLGNQGALALSRDGRRLYAVNAGSDDISVFAFTSGKPVLIQKVPSGGDQPISIALSQDLLYVLNAGGTGNISGFYVGDDRRVYPIPGSSRPLSGSAVGPAQISFNTFGDVLVVTEKATNKIDLYDVEDGMAQGPYVRDSNGMTPFGFAFDRHDHLIVSEAFGGAANSSAMSSYEIDGGMYPLEVVSGTVGTHQTAACWVVVSKNGRFAYTTNTGSSSITGYRIARNGALTLLNADGVTAPTGSGSAPLDAAISSEGKYLFALSPNVGMIASFRVRDDGSLRVGPTVDGVPLSASGLVAH